MEGTPPRALPKVSSSLKPILARLATGAVLTESEAEAAFDIIMSGEATPAQIGGLLMAVRVRGETVAEITGAARAMRARMAAVLTPEGAMDVCGTGGDGAGTLNVSTAVTLVVAGCGVPVAKHGNRALSSRKGARTSWPPSGSRSNHRSSAFRRSCNRQAACSCSPRATTPRCATPPVPAWNSAPAPFSTCSDPWPIRAA